MQGPAEASSKVMRRSRFQKNPQAAKSTHRPKSGNVRPVAKGAKVSVYLVKAEMCFCNMSYVCHVGIIEC